MKIRGITESRPVRYLFIGGLSYIIEIGAIWAFMQSGMGKITSVAIAFWVGLAVSFLLQKIFAFKNKSDHVHHLLRQVLLYGGLVAINYAFTLYFVHIANAHTGVIVARTIALVITTGWNYILYSRVIFKTR